MAFLLTAWKPIYPFLTAHTRADCSRSKDNQAQQKQQRKFIDAPYFWQILRFKIVHAKHANQTGLLGLQIKLLPWKFSTAKTALNKDLIVWEGNLRVTQVALSHGLIPFL